MQKYCHSFWWEMEKEGAQSLVTFAADFHNISDSQVYVQKTSKTESETYVALRILSFGTRGGTRGILGMVLRFVLGAVLVIQDKLYN